jgi:energy-coupling factor transport system ATP-binding protein
MAMQIIKIQDLTFEYAPGTPMTREALDGVSLSIGKGEFVGLAGQTGSGKSTLVQLIAGLLPVKSGIIQVEGLDPGRKEDLPQLRRKVGMVFQYPEHQLFDETVLSDVSFGPRNLELSQPEMRALKALKLVGLDPQEVAGRSPFALSGGQRRRVAIAGVLAMEPELLILDEPTAGLDPEGRRIILSVVDQLHKEGRTIILISHRMQELAPRVGRMVVLHQGRILLDGTPAHVFAQGEKLKEASLAPPPITELMLKLRAKGWSVRGDIFTVSQGKEEITRAWREKC